MKKHISILLLPILGALIFSASFAQAQKPSKLASVTIHTSANCDECKTRIEGAMSKVQGVKRSSLDVPSQDLLVTYSPKKTDVHKIRKAINMTGYDADDLPADQEAHDNLPACCRKGGHD